MIVAGIGCRKGATAEQIVAIVRQAVEHHGFALADLGLLTTGEIKRHEPGIAEAAGMLGVPLLVLDEGRLRAGCRRLPDVLSRIHGEHPACRPCPKQPRLPAQAPAADCLGRVWQATA